jgi:hypothetical protein
VNTANQKVKQRVYHAMKEFLVVTVYLWVIFGLFALYKSVILAEDHVPFAAKGFALINALVLAKVMVIAREFHFGEGFDDSPLIYPTLAKSASFSVLLASFKIIEESAVGVYHGKSFQQSIAALGGGTWQGIVCMTLLLFVTLIPLFGFKELQKCLGEDKLANLFFRSREVHQKEHWGELS